MVRELSDFTFLAAKWGVCGRPWVGALTAVGGCGDEEGGKSYDGRAV